MTNWKTRVAIIYDFDRTLSRSEMQDGFIKSLGMDPNEFWEKTAEFAKENSILTSPLE